jgi:hypothetical protein
MRIRGKVLLLFLFLSWTCLWGQTGERRAEDLLNDCTIGPSAEGVTCISYLSGFMEGITAVQSLYTSTASGQPLTSVRIVCNPDEGASGEQLRKIVVKYLGDHPEQLHMRPMAVVLAALGTAFPPCKK